MKLRTTEFIGLAMMLGLNAVLGASLEDGVARVVAEEMRSWGLSGVAVALVDDKETVLAQGYGEAERESVFRVGSISKLFNAVAVMQRVEVGDLDLDAPLPGDLLPLNPFVDQPPVTLRQLLSHRSGLQREGAVGGYLDPSEPSLAATVASLRRGVLVTRPEEMTRYSNLGPSVAGYQVAQVSGLSYPAYQQQHLLDPLGMQQSYWLKDSVPAGHLVTAYMRVADGWGGWLRQKAPVFDLGTIPAGNLFSTVDDVALFAKELIAGGQRLFRDGKTLEKMWQPQFTDSDRGFGLGFSVGSFRENRSVSHSGAVYGHSTSLIVLPDVRLACIVLANEDIANGRVRRISHHALNLLLLERRGRALPTVPATVEIDDFDRFAGDYESQSYWAQLRVQDGKLVGDLSGQGTRFSPTGPLSFRAESRIVTSGRVQFFENDRGEVLGFTLSGQRYQRVAPGSKKLPKVWHSLLGNYGDAFIPLIVSERFGHLYVMTENMVDYRLRPVNRHVWSLPPGMYVEEEIVFLTDANGRVRQMNFANMIFDRWD